MEIQIGREGDQAFPITDPGVSRKHAILRSLPDGTYQLEDVGSTYGTFVNGQKIIKTLIDAGDEVRLGLQYRLEISDLLLPFEKEKEEKKKLEELRELFQLLEQVYEDYTAKKIKLQRRLMLRNFYRTLPMVISTLLFGLTMLFDHSEWVSFIKPFMGGLMILFIGISTFLVYKGQKDQPAKMEELNQQFMIDYVCPACKNFLGYLPFKALVNREQCPSCKCKWV